MKTLFISDKELADLAGTSQATISRTACREGNFLGCVPLIVGKSRRWRLREIEAALGLANEETPKDAPKEREHEAPMEKIVGKWRTRTRTASKWGEAERVYRVADAVE